MMMIFAHFRGWQLVREDSFHRYYLNRDGRRHAEPKAPHAATEFGFRPDRDGLAGAGR
ncbi:hypothetical protein [Sphingomonas sp. MMS24-J13]|uniref:hypothetical protein n=1 Tax=Sphingomonas sp. MMS24-J13 TaxID=3238686 RepID=UPI00385040E8